MGAIISTQTTAEVESEMLTRNASAVAVVGEGVAGLSAALSIKRLKPDVQLTVFHDKSFEEICSFGPAGLFRIDNDGNVEKNRAYGKKTFDWYAELCRSKSGRETGVKLLSGHIQSQDRQVLDAQERAYGDIVYNFRWLSERERLLQFGDQAEDYCIHFSAYAAEGGMYVPFLKRQLKQLGVKFEKRKISNLDELGSLFGVVVNSAGLEGGRLAGDDDGMVPIRGVVFEVDAPWHKHFNYRNFDTFTIPKCDVVAMGSVKQKGRSDRLVTNQDREDIKKRYYKLHPALASAPIVSEWCNLRPWRKEIRVESQDRQTSDGIPYTVVHHYGHGGAGFTLAWGSGQQAAELVLNALLPKAKL